MNYEVYLKFSRQETPLTLDQQAAADAFFSTGRFAHMFPKFEMWQIEEVVGNNVYHIKLANKKKRFVRAISENPCDFNVEDWVIVGYYKSNPRRPFILAEGTIPVEVVEITIQTDWVSYLQNQQAMHRGIFSVFPAVTYYHHVCPNSGGNLMRIMGDDIYLVEATTYDTDGFLDTLLHKDHDGFTLHTYAADPQGAIVDVNIDPDNGDVYITEWYHRGRLLNQRIKGWAFVYESGNVLCVSWSRVTRLDRELNVVWHTEWRRDVAFKQAPSLIIEKDTVTVYGTEMILADYEPYDGVPSPTTDHMRSFLTMTTFKKEPDSYDFPGYYPEGEILFHGRPVYSNGNHFAISDASFGTGWQGHSSYNGSWSVNNPPKLSHELYTRGGFIYPDPQTPSEPPDFVLSFVSGYGTVRNRYISHRPLHPYPYRSSNQDFEPYRYADLVAGLREPANLYQTSERLLRENLYFVQKDGDVGENEVYNCCRYINLLHFDGIHLPCFHRTMMLAAFDKMGNKIWEKDGSHLFLTKPDGERVPLHHRQFYTPLLVTQSGELLVFVEENYTRGGSFASFDVEYEFEPGSTWDEVRYKYPLKDPETGEVIRPADPPHAEGSASYTLHTQDVIHFRVVTKKLSSLQKWDIKTGEVIKSSGHNNQLFEVIKSTAMVPSGSPTMNTWYAYEGDTTSQALPVPDESVSIHGIRDLAIIHFPDRMPREDIENRRYVAGAGGSQNLRKNRAGEDLPAKGLAAQVYYNGADIFETEITAPLIFNPLQCALSQDGTKVFFGPNWTNQYTTTEDGEPTATIVNNKEGPYEAKTWNGGYDRQHKHRSWIVAVDLETLDLAWKCERPFYRWGPQNKQEFNLAKFTYANPLPMADDKLLFHLREQVDVRDVDTEEITEDVTFARLKLINAINGEAIGGEGVIPTVNVTPFASWDQYPETGPNLLSLNQIGREVLYASRKALFTKDKNFTIIMPAENNLS